MKITRRQLKKLISEELTSVLEMKELPDYESKGGGQDPSGKDMEAIYDIKEKSGNSYSNFSDKYSDLTGALINTDVRPMMAWAPTAAFFGISSSGGYGGGGGGASTIPGLPAVFKTDSDVIARAKNLVSKIPERDELVDKFFGGESLKVLLNLSKQERASVMKILQKYYPPLAHAAYLYIVTKGTSMMKLANIISRWDPMDGKEHTEATELIREIWQRDPRRQWKENFHGGKLAHVQQGWDEHFVLFPAPASGELSTNEAQGIIDKIIS